MYPAEREARAILLSVDEALDWERVARAHLHPVRLRVLERMIKDPGRKWSAWQLAREFGLDGNKRQVVAYHVRELHKLGLLRSAGGRQVRGAFEHFYVLDER